MTIGEILCTLGLVVSFALLVHYHIQIGREIRRR